MFLAKVNKTNPEAVVFVASAVDTALTSQYFRTRGSQAKFFAVPWAQTNELLEKLDCDLKNERLYEVLYELNMEDVYAKMQNKKLLINTYLPVFLIYANRYIIKRSM